MDENEIFANECLNLENSPVNVEIVCAKIRDLLVLLHSHLEEVDFSYDSYTNSISSNATTSVISKFRILTQKNIKNVRDIFMVIHELVNKLGIQFDKDFHTEEEASDILPDWLLEEMLPIEQALYSKKNNWLVKENVSEEPKETQENNAIQPQDEPVQDEPVYCWCKRESFGAMIACDNNLCPIEWFHFPCVLVTVKPKGNWFCPLCRGHRQNIMKSMDIFLEDLKKYNKANEKTSNIIN